MSEPLVSIIIPFYNEEKQLKRALISSVNQTYKSVEIIVVNDGSTDNSLAIAKEFSDNYSNLSLYSQSNLGLSVSRNFGMEKAKGKYISFLDSDDELEPNAIELLVDNIQKSNSCISVCKFYLKKEDSSIITTSGWKSEDLIISSEEGINKMYKNEIAYTAWAKLYKASIAKKIQFKAGLWFEDRPFFLNYLLLSNTISFLDKPLLSIYTPKNSITRRLVSEKRIVDIQKIWEIEMDITTDNLKRDEMHQLIVRNHINSLYESLVFMAMDKNQVENFSSIRKQFNSNLKATKNYLKKYKIAVNSKIKLNLIFMSSNKFLGWNFFSILLKIRKKSQFLNVKTMRQN